MEPAGATVPRFIQRFQPTFPVGYNAPADVLNYLQVPVVTPGYVPKMVFIDRAGVIREEHGAGSTVDPYFEKPAETIRATLEQLLKAAAPAAHKGKKKK